MSPPAIPANDALRLNTREMFGMSIALEPEVAQSTIGMANARSLASIVADLLNANEPLLKAEADGATVSVVERGGSGKMRFTVESLR